MPKIFYRRLAGFLLLFNIIPIILVLTNESHTFWGSYFAGWAINLIMLALCGVMKLIIWLLIEE